MRIPRRLVPVKVVETTSSYRIEYELETVEETEAVVWLEGQQNKLEALGYSTELRDGKLVAVFRGAEFVYSVESEDSV